MRFRNSMGWGATLAMLALSSATHGALILTSTMSNDQEPPSGASPLQTSTGGSRPLSFGTATFTLNDAQTQLSMTATIFNIDITGTQTPDTFDNLTGARIHAPALPGNVGPAVWGFFGTPLNDNNPNNLVITPFAAGVGGTFTGVWDAPEGNATTLAAQIPNITSRQSYINFTTVQFVNGEIRGQIVPEPASAGVLGLAALAFLARRRRCGVSR